MINFLKIISCVNPLGEWYKLKVISSFLIELNNYWTYPRHVDVTTAHRWNQTLNDGFDEPTFLILLSRSAPNGQVEAKVWKMTASWPYGEPISVFFAMAHTRPKVIICCLLRLPPVGPKGTMDLSASKNGDLHLIRITNHLMNNFI